MTDKKPADNARAPSQRPGTLMGIAAAWLGALGAIAFTTLPSTAKHMSGVETAMPVTAAAIPANAISEVGAPHHDTLTLIRDHQVVDFIVRFQNDIPELDTCARTFRQDKAAAQSIFAKWAAQHDALEDMSLKTANYSGEMILSWDTGVQRPLLKTEIETRLAQIRAMPSVKYVDPDYTAQAEGGR